MNTCFGRNWLPMCLVVMTVAPGCQMDRNRLYMETLNQEKLTLEDRVYDLAYANEILLDKVRRLESRLGSASERPHLEPLPSPTRDRSTDEEASRDRETRPSGGEEPRRPDSPSPHVEPATNGAPPTITPPTITPPAITPPGAPPGDPPPPARAPQVRSGGVGPVASIRLNPLKTGGEDFDNRPGDDGIRLLVEPLGERGRFIAQAAPMTVVVLDPAIQGEGARVARWDLPASAVAESLRGDGPSQGLELNLPWPKGTTLQHERLHLFVRYTTPDGRQLEADREFFVDLASGVASRWTPRQSTGDQPSSGTSVATGPSAAAPRQRSPQPQRQAPQTPTWRPVR